MRAVDLFEEDPPGGDWRFPAERHGTADFVELLRIQRTLSHASEVAAFELEDELRGQPVDINAARLLWRTLLNTAQPFQAHPDVLAGARESLAAADGM
ncbi:hypothetical protein ACFC09_19025 [Streptomyces sp. NPDC056161]|uniref:hypothetical protein n=1 Tax=Streptomyces sp. NPDC056161 TaxID=3345732 RepID=UPI0035DF23F1